MSWTADLAHGIAEQLAAAGIATYRPAGTYRDDGTGLVVGAAGLTARYHFRCRAKNRFPSSPSNRGTPVCPPMLACSVFSLEPKASNRSRASCRACRQIAQRRWRKA